VAQGFTGKILRSYLLEGRRVLILQEGYEGDIEIGESVDIELPAGETKRGEVVNIAWGSAFHADSPPLTLVVAGVDDEPAEAGRVSGVHATATQL
jgi:hypothetical protein